MSKSIKIDDETYGLVAEFAEREDRPLSNALARLVKLGLDNASMDVSASGHSGTSGHTPLKDTSRGHTVTIPSVDTSQPRESITPHKRWVPTTPEELEAELEKVRRGEREP